MRAISGLDMSNGHSSICCLIQAQLSPFCQKDIAIAPHTHVHTHTLQLGGEALAHLPFSLGEKSCYPVGQNRI